MKLKELNPVNIKFNNVIRIPFLNGILNDDAECLKAYYDNRENETFTWYISTVNKNIESGSCLRSITTKSNVLAVEKMLIDCFGLNKKSFNKEYRDIVDIIYETYHTVKRFLNCVQEDKRLDKLINDKTLADYYLRFDRNGTYFNKYINKITNGNYLNAIHDTETKKALHLQLLYSIIVDELDLDRPYTDVEIDNIIRAKYEESCPTIKYLYIACEYSKDNVIGEMNLKIRDYFDITNNVKLLYKV